MTDKSAKALKAYAVYSNYDPDDGSGIFFALSNAAARRQGAGEFSDGDFHSVSCSRAPWADEYAPGPVPFKAFFHKGWWQKCSHCSTRISQNDEEYREQPFDIQERSPHVFCDTDCLSRYDREQQIIRDLSQTAIEHEKTRFSTRFPYLTLDGAPHVHIRNYHGTYHVNQLILYFTFPNATCGGGTWRFDHIGEQPKLHVSNGDLEAFYKLRVGAAQ